MGCKKGAAVIELLNLDCVEYMKTRKDKEFDIAIVDPPYGIRASMGVGLHSRRKYQKAGKEWDDQTPTAEYWEQLFRVSKNQIMWEGGSIHPTQKPVGLYNWLLQTYAKEGDKILDTHLGGASIAIACHYRGFDLVGCEIDEQYYNNALKRFKEQTAQMRLL